MDKLKVGILGSGRGSNFEAIAQSIDEGALNADIRVVISDVENSGILQLAHKWEIRAEFVNPGQFRTKMSVEAEARVIEILKEEGVDLVVLAGFMRIVGAQLLRAFPDRILNIHPSLLPKFPGLEAWRQALEAGETVTGCTVHYVDAIVDGGRIIAQEKVPILPGDTPESLHQRIQKAEHILYPKAISYFRSENL
ncbi:MAG: phosphoribosylglycinamide formyltransferase [Verrucomicrobia bacterium]|nr:MAG: phosphoribosylglycinamide formyltransferase [Verrucomicrobiota bacterium]